MNLRLKAEMEATGIGAALRKCLLNREQSLKLALSDNEIELSTVEINIDQWTLVGFVC